MGHNHSAHTPGEVFTKELRAAKRGLEREFKDTGRATDTVVNGMAVPDAWDMGLTEDENTGNPDDKVTLSMRCQHGR